MSGADEQRRRFCGTCKRPRIITITAQTSLGICQECGQSFGAASGDGSCRESYQKWYDEIAKHLVPPPTYEDAYIAGWQAAQPTSADLEEICGKAMQAIYTPEKVAAIVGSADLEPVAELISVRIKGKGRHEEFACLLGYQPPEGTEVESRQPLYLVAPSVELADLEEIAAKIAAVFYPGAPAALTYKRVLQILRESLAK